MKLNEAIEAMRESDGLWMRPVSWSGCGVAYLINDGSTKLVPGASGGVLGMTHMAEELAGEWEIVDPSKVLDESL